MANGCGRVALLLLGYPIGPFGSILNCDCGCYLANYLLQFGGEDFLRSYPFFVSNDIYLLFIIYRSRTTHPAMYYCFSEIEILKKLSLFLWHVVELSEAHEVPHVHVLNACRNIRKQKRIQRQGTTGSGRTFSQRPKRTIVNYMCANTTVLPL
jgi:hypothetical protein